jgi:hypothetical protein
MIKKHMEEKEKTHTHTHTHNTKNGIKKLNYIY